MPFLEGITGKTSETTKKDKKHSAELQQI